MILCDKPTVPFGHPVKRSNSDDEDDNARTWRRIRRNVRAVSLEHVADVLTELDLEDEEKSNLHIPPGVVVQSEVWKGSTFEVDRKILPLWKKLIGEHRRFHRELPDVHEKLEAESS